MVLETEIKGSCCIILNCSVGREHSPYKACFTLGAQRGFFRQCTDKKRLPIETSKDNFCRSQKSKPNKKNVVSKTFKDTKHNLKGRLFEPLFPEDKQKICMGNIKIILQSFLLDNCCEDIQKKRYSKNCAKVIF